MSKTTYYFDGIRNNNQKIIKELMKECYTKVVSMIRKRDSYKKIQPEVIQYFL